MKLITYESVILRILIPAALLTVSIVRYNLFSFVYFLFFLAAPLLRSPDTHRSKISIQIYLTCLITISCAFTLSHSALYVILAIKPPYDDFFSNCSVASQIAAAIGIQRLNTKFALALRLVAPDPAILVVAVAALVYFARKRRRSCLSSCQTEASKPAQHSMTSEVEENRCLTPSRDGDETKTPGKGTAVNSVVDTSRDDRTLCPPNTNALLSHGRRVWNAWALNTCNVLLTVFLTGAAGIIVPSVLSLFYLLMFLGMCTYWSSRHKVHSQEFMHLRVIILIYSGLHLCVYFLYQFPCAQLILEDSGLIARLLGLSYLVRSDCSRSGENIFPTDKPLFVFFAPVATLLLYYTVAMQLRPWLSNKINDRKFYWLFEEPFNPSILRRPVTSTFRQRTLARKSSSAEALPVHDSEQNLAGLQEPLISCTDSNLPSPTATATFAMPAVTTAAAKTSQSEPNTVMVSVHAPIARLSSVDLLDPLLAAKTAATTSSADSNATVSSGQHQRATGDANHDCCQTETTPVTVVAAAKTRPTFAFSPHLFPLIAHGPLFLSIHNSVIRNSYVLTFIAMMAWSVFFRSWLSFILLVSACILWILPNSRSACLVCSPLIVAYGMCIILLQYVYCFNLSETELPTYINHLSINLTEVGLHRWTTPVGPLALQLCFLIFFWLNLRLFTVERMANRRGLTKLPSRNASGVYPLQDMSSTTATIVASKAAWHQANSNSLPTLIMQTRPLTVSKPAEVKGHVDGDMATTTTATAAAAAAATISSSFPALNEVGLGLSFMPPPEPASPGNLGPGITIVDDERYTRFTNFLYLLCVRYWIALCCLTMLALSLRPPVVIFRIGYMLHLLYFFTLFMISYKLWRKQIIAFWWFAIGYSMVVLLCTYTYQFTSFPYYWQNGTGLSPQTLKAIGLEQFGSAELFDRMMMPVVFLVVIILQVHYFHRPSSHYSSLHQHRNLSKTGGLRSDASPSESSQIRSFNTAETESNFIEDVHSVFNIVVAKLIFWWKRSVRVLWRIAEVYWIKLISVLIVMSAIKEVTVANIIPVSALIICFPAPSLHSFLVTSVFIFTGLQIIMKMIFQLDIVSDTVYRKHTQTGFAGNPSQPRYSVAALLPNGTGRWIGLDVVDDFPTYISPLVLLFVSCALWHVIRLHQIDYYRRHNSSRPSPGIIFPEMTIAKMDEKILNLLKCIANYTFYKIGLEMCFCITLVAACLRVDALSVLYLLLMLAFVFTRRDICARLWLPYMVLLGFLIIVQYVACIGFPAELGGKLPWESTDEEIIRLQQWLSWPSMSYKPEVRKLSVDFLQYIFVAMQYQVFKLEQRPDWEDYGGGSNNPILSNPLPRPEDRDFISTKESYLDYIRHGIFYWSYWLSLAIVLATGVNWITLFCLGYMILSFIYLWMGQNVMMRKRANLVASWNVIIGYTFCVILAKCALQLMGCVYANRFLGHRSCWLMQLFGVTCMNPVGWNSYVPITSDVGCETVSNGLHWDVVCFIVIIFQRKIFTSDSFRQVVFDLNVQSRFASRGAFLINHKLMQVINEQAVKERRDLERVSKKLEKIAARQKQLGKNAANLNEHYMLIRSGDYYLFEGDPEEEEQDSGSDGDTKSGHQRGSGPDGEQYAQPGSEKADRWTGAGMSGELDSSHYKMQRQHLRDAWPTIETNTLDVLGHYTDPYTSDRPTGRQRPDTGRKDRRRKVSRGVGQSGNLSSSSDDYISAPSQQHNSTRPGYKSHRRLASYPETYSCPPTSQKAPQEAIEMRVINRRGTRFRSRIAADAARSPPRGGLPAAGATTTAVATPSFEPAQSHGATTRPSSLGHRRIASAGAITPSSGPSARTPNLPFSSSAQPISATNKPSANASETGELPSPSTGAIRPSVVTFAQPARSEECRLFHRAEDVDAGMMADADDDDDEDDANPAQTPASRMNPLQLLNQAIEHGARSTVRQYRKTMAAYQQQSMIGGEPESGHRRTSYQGDGNLRRTKTDRPLNEPRPASHRLRLGDPLDGSPSHRGPLERRLKNKPKFTKSESFDQDAYAEPGDGKLVVQAHDSGIELRPLRDRQTAAPQDASRHASVAEEIIVPTEEVHRTSRSVEKESFWSRFKASCLICHMFFLSTIDRTIRLLNGVTREHRRVRRTIDLEKRMVKRRVLAIVEKSTEDTQVDLESIVLEVISGNRSPYRSNALPNDNSSTSDVRRRPYRGYSVEERSCNNSSLLLLKQSDVFSTEEAKEAEYQLREKAFRRSRSSFFLLFIAIGNLVVVHSELFCYVILVLNHMRSANVLSLVCPLMVFLWAMLSVPRPTKTFWITLITYTEVIIIIKYIFQFRFIAFNDPQEVSSSLSKTHWLPGIFGIEKAPSYAIWDLIQLLFIFLHRSYLKNHGLWRDDTEFRQDLDRVVEANRASYSGSGATHHVGDDVSRGSHSTHGNTQSSSRFNPVAKMRRFYSKMTDPRYNKKVDVYVYMFICEFLSFWIIIFGYQSFGPSTGMGDNAFEFIKTNRIPAPFIGMIIIQSVFIVADRALFLRKQVLGKFIFQIFHVILIHIWLFFVLPQITLAPFRSGFARSLLYLVKCLYFGLSAYQIRSGYPQHILGNFLTKNYNYINLVLFKAYLIMPFLYELRSVMDWMWTDSPLSLYHWMELEDIYAKVFLMKCWRRSEIAYPTPLGQRRSIVTKYIVGLLLLLFAFLCFWGPLAVGSFIDTTFVINVPVECFQMLSLGGFPPIFSFTARENNLLHVDQSFVPEIRRCNALDQHTAGFLDNFKTEDISNMTFEGTSDRVWSITPPMYNKLMDELKEKNATVALSFRVNCRRSQKEVDSSARYVEQYFQRPLTFKERDQLFRILEVGKTAEGENNGSASNLSVQLNHAFPRFLLAQKNSLRNASGNLAKYYTYVNISASLHRDPVTTQYWWVLEEVGLAEPPCYGTINNLTEADRTYRSPSRSLSIITFNERVSDNILGKIFSSYGIIGMYAAYIFVASRLLRMAYNDISYIISLQELPHVDRLLNLCRDIYLVRENRQMHLEEQLFAKLIFLYRSSETMIKWTRHPKWLVEKFTNKTDDDSPRPPPYAEGSNQSNVSGACAVRNRRQTGSALVAAPDATAASPRGSGPQQSKLGKSPLRTVRSSPKLTLSDALRTTISPIRRQIEAGSVRLGHQHHHSQPQQQQLLLRSPRRRGSSPTSPPRSPPPSQRHSPPALSRRTIIPEEDE